MSANSSFGNSAPFEAKFKVVDEIGEGGFGKVYFIKLRNQSDDSDAYNLPELAMKVIKISRIAHSEKQVQYAKNEMKILASIDHPFIVKLFFAFHCSKRLYLVMEYMNGGDMRQLMDQKRVLSETETKFYTASISLALAHLHENNIIYRDLKPENIMFDINAKIKLVDLGLCKLFDTNSDMKTSTICGTIEYLAPEIVTKKPYGEMVDWWSLGILIHHMLIGYQPFRSDNKKKLINKIVSETISIPRIISKPAVLLLKQLLFKNHEKRLRWVKETDSTVQTSQLCIQNHPFFKKIVWSSILNGEVASPADLTEFIASEDRFSSNVNPTIRWSRLSGPDHTQNISNNPDDASSPAIDPNKASAIFKMLDEFSYVSPNCKV